MIKERAIYFIYKKYDLYDISSNIKKELGRMEIYMWKRVFEEVSYRQPKSTKCKCWYVFCTTHEQGILILKLIYNTVLSDVRVLTVPFEIAICSLMIWNIVMINLFQCKGFLIYAVALYTYK